MFIRNQVRLYHLASVHRWLLKAFYFLEQTEYDRGKSKDGLPHIYYIFDNIDYVLFLLITLILLYKQLGSGLSPERCLYSPGFWGSKLLNGYLMLRPRNLCLRGMQ